PGRRRHALRPRHALVPVSATAHPARPQRIGAAQRRAIDHGAIPTMQYLCLIIEPDIAIAQRLQRELPSFGFKPYTVTSCQTALTLLRQWRFDAVLLDAQGCGECYTAVLRKLHQRC